MESMGSGRGSGSELASLGGNRNLVFLEREADSFLGSGEVHLKTTSSSEPVFSSGIGGGENGAQRFCVHGFNKIWEVNEGS